MWTELIRILIRIRTRISLTRVSSVNGAVGTVQIILGTCTCRYCTNTYLVHVGTVQIILGTCTCRYCTNTYLVHVGTVQIILGTCTCRYCTNTYLVHVGTVQTHTWYMYTVGTACKSSMYTEHPATSRSQTTDIA